MESKTGPESDIASPAELRSSFENIQTYLGMEPGSSNPVQGIEAWRIVDDYTIIRVYAGQEDEEDTEHPGTDSCTLIAYRRSADGEQVFEEELFLNKYADDRWAVSHTPSAPGIWPGTEPWEVMVSRIRGEESALEFEERQKQRAINGMVYGLRVDDQVFEDGWDIFRVFGEAASLASDKPTDTVDHLETGLDIFAEAIRSSHIKRFLGLIEVIPLNHAVYGMPSNSVSRNELRNLQKLLKR